MKFQENLNFQIAPSDINSLAMPLLMARWMDKRKNLATISNAY